MLGATPGMGKSLGLDEKWAYNAIKGSAITARSSTGISAWTSPLKLERGYNNLWTQGRPDLRHADPLRSGASGRARADGDGHRSGAAAGPAGAVARPAVRGIVVQVLFVAAVVAVGGSWSTTPLVNLRRQNIATGFGFLHREAAFGIGESLIDYSPADTYFRAFLVGLTNTLYVSALGIVLATILGTVMGLARLSSNWLVAKLAQIYVETFRNIPLALQLLFWWGLLRESGAGAAPGLAAAAGRLRQQPRHRFPGAGRGPGLRLDGAGGPGRHRRDDGRCSAGPAPRQARTGEQFPTGWVGLGLILGLPLAVFLRRRRAAAARCAGIARLQLLPAAARCRRNSPRCCSGS